MSKILQLWGWIAKIGCYVYNENPLRDSRLYSLSFPGSRMLSALAVMVVGGRGFSGTEAIFCCSVIAPGPFLGTEFSEITQGDNLFYWIRQG